MASFLQVAIRLPLGRSLRKISQEFAIFNLVLESQLFQYYNWTMFVCWKPEQPVNTDFDLDRLPPCQIHNNPIQFICKQPSCREQSLLCVECLNQHKEHTWDNLRSFFTSDVQQILVTGNSNASRRIQEAGEVVKGLFESFQEKVKGQIKNLQEKIIKKLDVVYQNNLVQMRGGQQINQESISELLNVLQKEKSIEWVQNLKILLESAIEEAVKTIDTIMDDLEVTMGTEWEVRTHLENELALKELKTHLHYHKEKDPNYFKFHPQTKHPGIQISQDQLEALFRKNLPSRPVVIASNPITLKIRSFAFQIKKLDTTALIFPSSTIFIGVCNPLTVKAVGMRRISQVGKGAYMIGSSGWSYHHKNAKYDRKNVVGFSFSQGEKINVEVQVDQPGEIRFWKEGRFFKSSFSMPLDLSHKQILELKPCVSFDGDEGAIIRLINN